MSYLVTSNVEIVSIIFLSNYWNSAHNIISCQGWIWCRQDWKHQEGHMHFQNHYRHKNHQCIISKIIIVIIIIILKVISYFAMVGAREGKKDSAKVTPTHVLDFCSSWNVHFLKANLKTITHIIVLFRLKCLD